MPRDLSSKKIYKNLSDVDFKRSVFLFDFFYQETAEKIVSELIKLDNESKHPINVFINSYGGEVYSLFSIVDTIRSIESPVNTICLGEADSCGAVLLSAGDVRYIGSNSRTMIHEVSTMAWGKVSTLAERVQLAKDTNDKLISILSETSGRDAAYLSEIMKKDYFMDASESVEMGLADFVLEEPKEQELFDKQTLDFINSFSGHSKDQEYSVALYALAGNARVEEKLLKKQSVSKGLIDKITSFLNKKEDVLENKKGEEIMDKEQMLTALKEEHGVDVSVLTSTIESLENKVSEKETAVSDLQAKVEQLQATIQEVEENKQKDELEALLASLIHAGKATQITNEINREAFKAMGMEKAKERAEKMPVIFKTERLSRAESDDNVSEKDSLAIEIENLSKEKNIDFAAATRIILSKKGDK